MTLLLSLILLGAPLIELSATQLGLNGAALSAGNPTRTIDMEGTNQLSLTLTVTPGTTTAVTVKCYESATGAANSWGQISVCDGNAAANCAPDARTYPMTDYETQGTVKVIESRWHVTKRYAMCKPSASGTGTLVLTATRSWQ